MDFCRCHGDEEYFCVNVWKLKKKIFLKGIYVKVETLKKQILFWQIFLIKIRTSNKNLFFKTKLMRDFALLF